MATLKETTYTALKMEFSDIADIRLLRGKPSLAIKECCKVT